MRNRKYLTKKKMVAAIVMAAMTMSVLAGCGSTQEAGNAATTAANGSTQTEATTTAGSQQASDSAQTTGDTTSAEVGKYQDGSSPTISDTRLRLTIDGQEEVIIQLYDNTAADALIERLPLTDLHFYDLSGIEKPIERLDESISLGDEKPGYDPVTGEMVIYRPWGNFTIFYGDFRYSAELVPLGRVESGLEYVANKTRDFTGVLEVME